MEHVDLNHDALDDLWPALRRLDALLARAVAAAQDTYGSEASTDPYRGLYISRNDVERMLGRAPGHTLFHGSEDLPDTDIEEATRLMGLARTFELSAFDLDVLLVALAPDVDLRYQRLYAFLQDDVTRKQPSVDLVLNLLCPTAEAKLARRVHFATEAPLVRHGLLRLLPEPSQAEPPLLAHIVKLDDQIGRFLLGPPGLDPRLATFCRLVEPRDALADLPLPGKVRQTLGALGPPAWAAHRPLRLYFYGRSSVAKRRAAEALAGAVGASLLVADLERVGDDPVAFERHLELLFREARFRHHVLYLDGIDALRSNARRLFFQRLLDVLATDQGILLLSGTLPWVPTPEPLGMVTMDFPLPGYAARRRCWRDSLAAAGLTADEADLAVLAGRFRLRESQVAEAVAVAASQVSRSPDHASYRLSLDDLFASARAQSGHELATLARKVDLRYTWDDIVLPDDTLGQLHEMCDRIIHRHQVIDAWGFGRKLSQGKGVHALFAGSSGTGKTMAAEILAHELKLDLYKIDLSGVVSKYIGETEKNLDRIFQAAHDANAILFFDEADALFGKRSEVRDSHDRYANIEISYLLQKMEEYEGMAILATNLRQNLDEAFIRRLAFTVHFSFPDAVRRRLIWDRIWPPEIPLADDVDFDRLAQQYKLSGGNVKNVALAAAFLAAAEQRPVSMLHLIQAVRREYQKMGKALAGPLIENGQSLA